MANDTQTEKPKTRSIGPFDVPDELADALDEIKTKTGMKVSEFIRDAAWAKVGDTRANHPAFQPATAGAGN